MSTDIDYTGADRLEAVHLRRVRVIPYWCKGPWTTRRARKTGVTMEAISGAGILPA